MAPVFITVYYNGHVDKTTTEGVVFRCDNSCLVKLRSKFKLEELKQTIEKKFSSGHPKKVVRLIYRYPTTLAAGHKFYEELHLCSDDDVDMMLGVFKECKHLGLSTPEVYADLMDAPSYETQTQNPFSENNISYETQTPASYPQFIPSSFQTHLPYAEETPYVNTQSIPSSSVNPIDLNISNPLDTQTDTPPISIIAGVHNEEVGEFSEDEDDILERHDEEEPIVGNPHTTVSFHDPPPHFRNITHDNIQHHDDEFGHSMDRNRECTIEDPINLRKKMRFPTKEMAQHFIQTYHLNQCLDFKVDYSNTERWMVSCVHVSCPWKCTVRLGKISQVWEITQLQGPHTCTSGTLSQDHRQLTANLMCDSIIQLVRSDPTISVSVLIAHIREKYTYTSTYRKAWIAKQKAIERIYGNWEGSYNQVTKWLLALSYYIPDTKIDFEWLPFIEAGQQVAGKGVFHRIFWSFGPCIKGFHYCKPVVSVDGTWLYGRYKGTLLMAIAQDGRSNCFPIAYVVVEGETADAWYFFLSRLREWVTPQDGLCLISDRHESIKSAVRRLNSNWKHVFCIRHIAQNFMRHFKNATARKHVINMGYSMNEYSAEMYKSKVQREAGEEAVAWVDDIEKEQWLQWCDGGHRWGHMTTNLAECINKVLKGLRNLPIRSLVESTYYRLTETFVQRGREAEAMLHSGQVYSEKLLEHIERNRAVSNTHSVSIHNRAQSVFRVEELVRPQSGRPAQTFKVDFRARICDCGEFQALHYPCSHVIAASSKIHYDHMFFVPPQYTLDYVFKTYFVEFPALPIELSWSDFNGIELQHDPNMRREKKGRPKSSRIRTEMDQTERSNRTKRCGLCRNEGHNRNNCPNRNIDQWDN